MAQRSSGIFPREGFNLDEANVASGATTTIGSNLADCKTVRVIAYPGALTDLVVTLGTAGPTIAVPAGEAPYIYHMRGALIPSEAAGSVIGLAATSLGAEKVYFEKVD